MRRRAMFGSIVVGVALLVSGCSMLAAPAPTGTSTPAPRATPTPAATPTAARIELGPEFTRALTASGDELWRIDYDSDPAIVVERISRTLGTPTVNEHAGTPNGDADLPATDYDWGGLELRSPDYSGSQPSGDGSSDYSLVATTAVSHDVALVTSSGVSVGMTRADLDPIAAGFTTRPSPSSNDWVYLESWTRTTDGSELTDWVSARVADGSVSQIFATARSYGA